MVFLLLLILFKYSQFSCISDITVDFLYLEHIPISNRKALNIYAALISLYLEQILWSLASSTGSAQWAKLLKKESVDNGTVFLVPN